MDGTAAIQDNLQALKRILAGLVSMAGLGALTSPSWEGRREASGGGRDAEDTPTRRSDDRRPPHKGEVKPAFTLPRRLRLAILRLLRPAEAAARRLIIASARGLVVALPPQRDRKPKPATVEPFLRRFGIAIVMSPAAAGALTSPLRGGRREASGGGHDAADPEVRAEGEPRRTTLPLFDPPRRFRTSARRPVSAHAAPRILFPGVADPSPLPPPPSPDDPIDATRLALRLAALAAALDDLPAQARRFARWQARRKRDRSANSPSPQGGGVRGGGNPGAQRISPLRPGRPPGGRLARFDPSARHSRSIRDIDAVLAHAHALALYALQYPDTS